MNGARRDALLANGWALVAGGDDVPSHAIAEHYVP